MIELKVREWANNMDRDLAQKLDNHIHNDKECVDCGVIIDKGRLCQECKFERGKE